MAEENEAPSLFELLGPPISTDQGTIYDYDVSSGEMLGAGFGRQLDTNVGTSFIARPLSFLGEDLMAIAGASEWVGAETARKEITGAGLELTVPDNGISRYELDTLKYLKKREGEQNQIMARNQSTMAAAAGFAGGLAAGLTDPLNIASAFIPIVPQARYAAWVAEASGVIGRAGVRAGVGLAEGAAGAALLEPFAYAGAQMSQLEYTAADSFINIVFGGVMGGGLHSAGGVGFDFFNAGQIAAAKEVGNWLPYLTERESIASAPDEVKMGALQSAVRALEDDLPVNADEYLDAWHGSPHKFDEFRIEAIGSGEGKQGFGFGFYAAQLREVAARYREALSSRVNDSFGAKTSRAVADEFKTAEAIDAEIQKRWKTLPRMGQPGFETLKRFQEAKALLNGEEPGYLYKVRLRLKEGEIIDYDKPFSQQTGPVRDALEELGFRDVPDEAIKEQIQLRLPNGGDELLTADLLKLGVKGIRFLDGLSRDTGDGTFNYVVFDPADIAVVERNGEPIAKARTPKKDTFEAEDMETSALADKAVSMGDDLESVASDVEFLDAQINGMKTRDMWTKGDDAALEAGEAVAKKLEDTASIYRAAAVCMAE